MKSGKGRRKTSKTGVADFEDAMNQAFSEIFQNLKMIEQDTKKQREKVDLQRRRRVSAPAATHRETVSTFNQPKNELGRKFSTPTNASTLSTMHAVGLAVI